LIINFGTAPPDFLGGGYPFRIVESQDGERRSPYMDVLARAVLKGYPLPRKAGEANIDVNFETI
jgi:hypothetical protein